MTRQPCPSPDLIGAFAEGRLLDEERAVVEAHLGGCAACAAEAAMLVRAGVPSTGESTRAGGTPTRWRYAAAAAAIVALIGALAWFLTPKTVKGPPRQSARTDDRLIAEVASLQRSHAGVFEGFAPLSQAERRAVRPDLQRTSGPVLIRAPRGKTRSRVAEILVAALPPTNAYSVLVLSDAGVTHLSFDGTIEPGKPSTDRPHALRAIGDFVVFAIPIPKEAPGLKPGHYLVEVTATSPLGSATARESFEVVSDDDRGRFDSALAAIAATAPADLAPLLASHYAWRQGFFGDAFDHALVAAVVAPDDETTSETLTALLQR